MHFLKSVAFCLRLQRLLHSYPKRTAISLRHHNTKPMVSGHTDSPNLDVFYVNLTSDFQML